MKSQKRILDCPFSFNATENAAGTAGEGSVDAEMSEWAQLGELE